MNKRLNSIYVGMKNRCYNSNQPSYKDYGARGITICTEWLNKEKVNTGKALATKGWLSFQSWALSHGYSDGLTIDRIDNSKGYSPDNCRWVSRKVQNNNHRNNHWNTMEGQTKTMAQWCEEKKCNYNTIRTRIYKLHLTPEQAFDLNYNTCIRTITFKGKTQSIAAWAREKKINYQTLVNRINKGWPLEKVFENKNNNLKLISYKGRKQCLKDWCKELKLNYSTVMYRINKSHWSVERAFETK